MTAPAYPPQMSDLPWWVRWNCLNYALWVQHTFGGYLLIRRSQLADMYALPSWHPIRWVPHFLAQPYFRQPTHLGPTVEQRDRDSAAHWSVFWLRLWRIPRPRIIVGDVECQSRYGSVPLLESR